MNFPSPLVGGRLIRRYKRFFADVALNDGSTITAHCPNTGTMLGLCGPDIEVWLSRSDNPKRKLSHTWELAREPGQAALVGVNPMQANRIVAEALGTRSIAGLPGYDTIRPEVRYGEKSRVDFVLSGAGAPDCFVEVKNVHLCRTPGLAEFPDAVTARGTRHLHDLAAVVAAGHRAVMLFLVQRDDCSRFAPAEDIDPAYAQALRMAQDAGVTVLCIACRISLSEIAADRSIELA